MSTTDGLSGVTADSKEQLAVNLRRLVSDAEELLSATADYTDSKMADLRARARENLLAAREKLADLGAAGRDRAREVAHATDDYVHDNPWTSIGVAAAVGLFIGVLLGRR